MQPDARLDRGRFGRVLALFDSATEGERHAALEAANRLLTAAGLRWRDLLGDNGLDLDDTDDAADRFRRARAAPPAAEDHRALCARLLRDAAPALTAWEAGFLRGMIGFGKVSAAQRRHLDEIALKVETARRYWREADDGADAAT